MRILNPELFGNIILPGLLGSTLWSVPIAIVIGTVVGSIIGAFRKQMKRTILPAIAGSFFGTMLLTMLPIYATPGIVGGGAYGGIIIMFIATVTLPIGAIGGAIAGSFWGVNLFKHDKQHQAVLLLLGTYCVMALVIYTSVSLQCSRRNTLPLYCESAGYPSQ
ncbi:MAG: hypothetical protein IGS48_20260 [Oscillatoriales cyanobacterium C42_A2020_001]|nr:hypothetical protein [Leptolyngbyaceae cyanobacterium C42_A2020_001]